MDVQTLAAIGGLVGAVLTAAGLFFTRLLSHIKELRDSHREELREQRQGFEAALKEHREETQVFLGNHMGSQTAAQQDVATNLRSLSEMIQMVLADLRRRRR